MHNLYGGAVHLSFEPKKHTYLINGKEAVSVTTVTGTIDKSAALMGWVAKGISEHLAEVLKPGMILDEIFVHELCLSVKKIHREKSRSAADLGTIAHDWSERYIKNKLKIEGFEPPAVPVNEKLKNCVTAMLDWESRHAVKWVDSERKVASLKHHFAGTEDFEAIMNLCGKDCCSKKKATEVYVSGDWKTSNSIKYPEYFIQTGAYWGACQEEAVFTKSSLIASHRVLVRFGKEDGVFESHVTDENKSDYEAFL